MSQNSLLKTCLNTKIGILMNKQQTHIYIVRSKHYVIEIPSLGITRKNEVTGSRHGWQKIEDFQDLSQENHLTFCFWKCVLSAS